MTLKSMALNMAVLGSILCGTGAYSLFMYAGDHHHDWVFLVYGVITLIAGLIIVVVAYRALKSRATLRPSISAQHPPAESTDDPLPSHVIAEIDQLYDGLRKALPLLREGRKFGVRVGLTEKALTIMRVRHGQSAEAVLSNCVVIKNEQESAQ